MATTTPPSIQLQEGTAGVNVLVNLSPAPVGVVTLDGSPASARFTVARPFNPAGTDHTQHLIFTPVDDTVFNSLGPAWLETSSVNLTVSGGGACWDGVRVLLPVSLFDNDRRAFLTTGHTGNFGLGAYLLSTWCDTEKQRLGLTAGTYHPLLGFGTYLDPIALPFLQSFADYLVDDSGAWRKILTTGNLNGAVGSTVLFWQAWGTGHPEEVWLGMDEVRRVGSNCEGWSKEDTTLGQYLQVSFGAVYTGGCNTPYSVLCVEE